MFPRYDHKRPPLDGIKTAKSFSHMAENPNSTKGNIYPNSVSKNWMVVVIYIIKIITRDMIGEK